MDAINLHGKSTFDVNILYELRYDFLILLDSSDFFYLEINGLN